MTKSLIVRFQIKEAAKVDEKPMAVSGDFYTALEDHVKNVVERACRRAKENGRNTVMGKDV